MRFVLASNNARKLEELRQILSQMGHEVLSQREAGLNLTVEETGTTFEENARLKARGASDALGLPVIADDSGLVVDALDGAPGVYSARYGGEGLDDTDRWKLLLKNLSGSAAFPNKEKADAFSAAQKAKRDAAKATSPAGEVTA